MAPWTLGRFTRQWHQAMAAVWGRRNAALRPLLLTTLLITGVVGGVTLWLASQAWRGDIADTVLLVAVQGIAQMVALGPLGDTTVNVRRVQATESAIRQLRADLGALRPTVQGGAEDARTPSAAAVSMSGVDFTYPAGTVPVLQGLDLVVKPGTSLGVVGVNGAGKSTIVKLLCGLYEPGAGSVTIDGIPAGDAVARGRVAVVLQDFVRYRRSLRDNLRFAPEDGAADSGTDDHVRWLTQAGGAEVLADLPAGWDTVLDPAQEGGTDLSGGQWQRVALARALAAIDEGAGLLVLDEPTAALDIRSEVALFEHLLEAARGVTTILVSHRLSSVRRTDRIVVVDGGAIVEDGSHDQLMAADGVYAEAFRLQASRFAEEVPHA
jgi:ABC-type multidrug transport system fused ATPase/permease subunit